MEQFTASEVRDAITWKYGDKLTRISAMLNAFADLLEAREKAVPVATVRQALTGSYWIDWHGKQMPDYLGCDLYTHRAPSDAKRLAEALRKLVSEWVAIADDGDATLEDSTIGYRACANRLSAILAAQENPND